MAQMSNQHTTFKIQPLEHKQKTSSLDVSFGNLILPKRHDLKELSPEGHTQYAKVLLGRTKFQAENKLEA